MKTVIRKKKRKKAQGKAREHMDYLLAIARETYIVNSKLSKRCIQLARAFSKRYKNPLQKEKQTFCTKCNTALVAGNTSRIRFKPGIKKVTCLNCNTVKRIPFAKQVEQ
jgi:RNase P subunit RPR2